MKCKDCGEDTNPLSLSARRSHRCDECQEDRDEYYKERMKQEHPPQRSFENEY